MGRETADFDGFDALAGSLLEAPPRVERPTTTGWLGRLTTLAVTLFIAYHGAAIFSHNLPNNSLTIRFKRLFSAKLGSTGYISATGNTQQWDMFAPDPWKSNAFLHVSLLDRDGQVHDLHNDVTSRRTHPYLLYDRKGKINRRLLDNKTMRSVLAAWYCREWERQHDGEKARSIQMFSKTSDLPRPGTIDEMTFDPRELRVRTKRLETLRCAALPHGQLTARQRSRLGMPPPEPGSVVPVEIRNWTDPATRRSPVDRPRARAPESRR